MENIAVLQPMARASVENGNSGKARIPAQHAGAVAQITEQVSQPASGPHITCDFFHQQLIAEIPARCCPRGLGSLTGLQALVFGDGQVRPNFFVQVFFCLLAPENPGQPVFPLLE